MPARLTLSGSIAGIGPSIGPTGGGSARMILNANVASGSVVTGSTGGNARMFLNAHVVAQQITALKASLKVLGRAKVKSAGRHPRAPRQFSSAR